MFKVPSEFRNRTHSKLSSSELDGNNGLFQFVFNHYDVHCIASDSEGFEHVSVTINRKRTPSWDIMNHVKDLFWDAEDLVVQFHPPRSQYINCHPYCLHLWRSDQIQALMLPDKGMI